MKKLRIIVIILTLLQVITAVCFQVPGFEDVIFGPQHGYLHALGDIRDLFPENGSSHFWYCAFFVNDIIWIATLLSLLYCYLLRFTRDENVQETSNTILTNSFLGFAFLTFLFDGLENTSYLLFDDALITWLPLQVIVSVKIFAFTACLLIILLGLYQKYIYTQLDNLKKSFKASIISLAGIALLFGLSTFMDQGSTVIIHLLDSPTSLLWVIILINLLTLVSGHYPDYINKYLGSEGRETWQMHGLFGGNSNTGLGLITYTITPRFINHEFETARQMDGINETFFNHFRKIIGVIVMITWLYVLLFVFYKYVPILPPLPITLIVIVLSLILHFHSSNSKQRWREFVRDNIRNYETLESLVSQTGNENSEDTAIPTSLKRYLNITMITFLLVVLSSGITVFSAFSSEWIPTWICLTVTTVINTAFIILFLNFRTLLSLPLVGRHLRWVPIAQLGKDVRHVRFYALTGFVTLASYMIITINPSATNALVIILMAIYLLYGGIIILIKHHVYYATDENGLMFPFLKKLFTLFVPIIGFLFLVWVLFNGNIGNGLHKIPIIEESSQLVELDTFKKNLAERTDTTKFLIASYGGGIRATAWTMLILDTLDKSDNTFFNNTVAMSGVSGGFLGLSFYTSIRAEHEKVIDRNTAISAIGRHNLLSIDISYLFGFDMIRELIPFVNTFRFRDRAGRSMDAYAALIQPDTQKKCNLLYASYRSYWAEAYQASLVDGSLFPVLIGNTTGTNSHYGVAFPMPYTPSDGIFPGAIDILTIGNKAESTIAYLDATSTTERFPIFSPAADIREKGNFLDGGYFENSGLLSLMNFYEFLEQDDSLHLDKENTKLIVLINSKTDYIRKVLGDSFKTRNNKATSELGAILKTVTDISTLSLALEKKYNHQFEENYIPVYLPYPITYDDVKNMLGGVPTDPIAVQQVMNTSNKKIEEALEAYCSLNPDLKNKLIPPALARVLSDPAFHYTKAMLLHPEVKDALARVKQE